MMREETVGVGTVQLDCGEILHNVEQRVTLYGTPRPDGSNVVLVTHALTGSSRAADWWPGVVGEHALLDPRHRCIVGVSALGSCYGSTGPVSLASDDRPYAQRFGRVTVRDIVRAARLALQALGIERIDLVIGGSLGGMQALQWALDAPQRVGRAIAIGAHDHHSAMGIALNAVQRDALRLDPARGLRLARKIAMLTYKSADLLHARHDRRLDRFGKPCFDVEGYLERQADRIESRMDPFAYATLTHAMDSFDVRDVYAVPQTPPLTLVGITSDWLFRPQDVRAAADGFVRRGFTARYLELHSDHGHDAFLAEPTALRMLLEPVVARDAEPASC